MNRHVVLCTPITGKVLERILRAIPGDASVSVIRSHDDLLAADVDANATLIGFGTGIIVPASILRKLRERAYNFHAAPPEFPGRDPHHFAAYLGVKRYGATAHAMTERVDAGGIVGVEYVDVELEAKPAQLLSVGENAAIRLFERLIEAMLGDEPLPALGDVAWGPRKTTRADFLAMCRLPLTIDEEEFQRRFQAFDGERYDNLTTRLHGYTFRIDKREPRVFGDPNWEGFTEHSYRGLLDLIATNGYRTAKFGEKVEGKHVLWRHDVDMSVHRAAKLADMESERGVVATYFMNPHSAFYNLLEPEALRIVQRIVANGHAIGLHFDSAAFDGLWTVESLTGRLEMERSLLESYLKVEITAFSYHNPDIGQLLDFDDDVIAGMANTYGKTLRNTYKYCSDSNGYWRFQPIPAVLKEGHERLHVLTHPEWWAPAAMPPRARAERCAYGRANAVMREYDRFLLQAGRSNISDSIRDSNAPDLSRDQESGCEDAHE